MPMQEALKELEKEARAAGIDYRDTLTLVRRQLVYGAIDRSGGDSTKAASYLRVTKATVNKIIRDDASNRIQRLRSGRISIQPSTHEAIA